MVKKTASKVTQRAAQNNPVVGVAARIGGVTVALVALIMIFGEGYRWVAFPVTACMVILGIFLGYYATKR